MAEVVHVGCADLPTGKGWERYFEKLSFVETSILLRKPPRPSVLAKWRAAAPGAGAFSVVAPPIVERPLGVAGGTAPVVAAAQALEAGAVVFRTPPTFSPSAANRDTLRRFFGEVAHEGTFGAAVRAWHPDGLWEVRTALKLANELGVVLVADPFVRDATRDPPDLYATLETSDVYFRVTGMGRGQRRLGPAQLEELADATSAYERAWVVFATVDAFVDATRFQRTLGAVIAPPSDESESE